MNQLPEPVQELVGEVLLRAQRVLWLRTDHRGRCLSVGGEAAAYGPAPAPGDDAAAALPFLEGLLPGDGTPLDVPTVNAGGDVYVDVARRPDGQGGDWTLVRDVSDELRKRQLLQQRQNELGLARDELARRARELQAANAQLDQARRRADELLAAIFPPSVAARLHAGEQQIAEHVADATVVFVAVEGFLERSSRLDALATVELLGRVFARFDAHAERLGVEKIKTVGEVYIAAAGVSAPRDDHAHAAARFALAVQADAPALRWPIPGPGVGAGGGAGGNAGGGATSGAGEPLSVRAGLDTGPIVAGVIGAGRLAYDLWGPTVRTASLAAMYGVPGQIHVTRAVRDALGGAFALTRRGSFLVPHAGELETFLVQGQLS